MNKSVKTITACVACAAALGLGAAAVFLNKDKKAVPTFSNTPQSATDSTEPAAKLSSNWADNYEYSPSAVGMTERARSLLRLNKDIAGWIKIDGLQLDYPFVKDPGEISADNKYYGGEEYVPDAFYLDHDLYRNHDEEGTLYLDYRNNFGSNEDEQSENQVIYGHAMWNGDMMGCLRKYRNDFDFYKVSPFIELSSNYKEYDYVIFAFLITSGSYNATDFHYWNMEELDTEEEFNFYIDNCKRSWLMDTGVDVKYGDKLVTLSTCYADEDNSRFLVVARRLREGEVAGDMTTIQRTEEYKQKQKEEAEKAAQKPAEEQQAQ
ncbi:class B sortase [Ruminococcus flavefaciens]|uniref:class B sortase n=1 Tax=Ruminococcus flavefaciens TaxID=1265 RepID=UPI0026E96745|nr:class B sortase [Ruminococcus flavefaciens]MDD7517517.1 class B sortase [Ruminococcus flavefaciens]MDY5691488.1 class B sortase [Ruminococcus flavefaciens]